MASKENQPGAKTRIVRELGIAGILAGTRATTASAQFKIGAIISFTDPAAALGDGYKSAFAPFPAEINGRSVTYIIRDDAADATRRSVSRNA